MMNTDFNARLIDVTVGEVFEMLKPKLETIMKEVVEEAVENAIEEKEVYGIPGIQKLLGGCCRSKAQEVKNSGILDPAITQNGRKIIVDSKLAKKLLKQHSYI